MKLLQQPSFLFCLIASFLFLLLGVNTQAQELKAYNFNDTAAIHIVTMKTGTVMRGKVIQIVDKDYIIFEFQGKKFQLSLKNIVRIDVTGPDPNSAITQHYPYQGRVRPGPRSENIFFSTTGFSLSKGERELLVQIPAFTGLFSMEWGLGRGWSVTTGYVFPSVFFFKTKGVKTLTSGLSVGGGAVILSPITFPEETLFSPYGILTLGNRRNYFNINLGPAFALSESTGIFLLSPGFHLSLGDRFRLAGETYLFLDEGEIYSTYLLTTLGWSKKHWGFDFGIINLSEDVADGFGPLPYISFNYRF
ncbi:MAG: hypothetical protein AAGG75_12365 [Bacteroidota bacterium]